MRSAASGRATASTQNAARTVRAIQLLEGERATDRRAAVSGRRRMTHAAEAAWCLPRSINQHP
jgi:hypothetical protein